MWFRSPLEEMKYLLKFIFPFRFYSLSRRRVLALSTQCLETAAESEKRSVLTLGSLCPSYNNGEKKYINYKDAIAYFPCVNSVGWTNKLDTENSFCNYFIRSFVYNTLILFIIKINLILILITTFLDNILECNEHECRVVCAFI